MAGFNQLYRFKINSIFLTNSLQNRLEKLSLSKDAKQEKREKNIRQRQVGGVVAKSYEKLGNLGVGTKVDRKKKSKGAGFDGKKLGFLNQTDDK